MKVVHNTCSNGTRSVATVPRALTSGKTLEPTSPRSVEACLRLGIEPDELHFMPLQVFVDQFGAKDLAQIAYDHHETVRQVITTSCHDPLMELE